MLLTSIGILLEAALLFRGLQIGLVRRYVYFYFSLAFQMITDVAMAVAYARCGVLSPKYASLYWPLEYSGESVLLVCLSLQILGILGLSSPNLLSKLKFFQRAVWVVVAVFTILFGWAVFNASPAQNLSLHRDFELAETIMLGAAVWAILRFDVPLGRHVKGMILGYGIAVAGELLSFAIYAYSLPFLHRFRSLPSLFALICYVIWLVALWSDERRSLASRIAQSLRTNFSGRSTRLQRVAIVARLYVLQPACSRRPASSSKI